MDLDLLITSSSRPRLFPYCWESFKHKVHFEGKLRVLIHEDFAFPKMSERVITYLNSLKDKKEIHEIYTHNPAIGLGPVLDEMLKKIKTKYMFYLQEDWEFERPIELDRLLWVMDNNPNINLIAFNKIRNTGVLHKIAQPQYTYSGVDMVLCYWWPFLPGIWRMSHVRQYWRMRKERPEGYFTNAFGSHVDRSDNEYCKSIMGAYMLGKTGEFRYVRHLGSGLRMATWRLDEGGKPGGTYDPVRMDQAYRASWLPSLPTRPCDKEGY